MPNLIVIIFNMLYSVCIVEFHCRGCVIERVVWRLKHLKTEEGFTGISRLSILQSTSCALHRLKCEESGQMETTVSREYLAGKAFPRDTRETFCSVNLSSLIHTFCAQLFIPILPTNVKGASERKPYPNNLRVRDCQYLQFSTHLFWEFPHLIPLNFHTIERLIAQTLTTPFESVR